MKRLVIATDNYLPRWDGISRFLSEIIPGLRQDYHITVIAPDYGKWADAVELVQIPRNKKSMTDFRLAKIRPFQMWKHISKADIVFTQTVGPVGATAFILALLFRKKRVAFIHSIEWDLVPKVVKGIFWKNFSYYLLKLITRIIYTLCNLLIVPSEQVQEILNWRNIKTRKFIVNLGTDAEKFKPGNRPQAKARLGLNPKDMVIGYHGRVSPEKDVATLIRAFNRLEKANPNLRLLIVGEGSERLKPLVKQHVVLVGPRNDVFNYLNAMDIYCHPSHTETTCLSVLEAMSCQLPVITTSVGYIRDYIKNGRNGLFFEKGNSYDLCEKIKMLIEDPGLRQRMALSARDTIVKNFRWENTVANLVKALKQV